LCENGVSDGHGIDILALVGITGENSLSRTNEGDLRRCSRWGEFENKSDSVKL